MTKDIKVREHFCIASQRFTFRVLAAVIFSAYLLVLLADEK
jgi:hypothetical protein